MQRDLKNEGVVRIVSRTLQEDGSELGEQQFEELQLFDDEIIDGQRVGRDDSDLRPIVAHAVVHGDPSLVGG